MIKLLNNVQHKNKKFIFLKKKIITVQDISHNKEANTLQQMALVFLVVRSQIRENKAHKKPLNDTTPKKPLKL